MVIVLSPHMDDAVLSVSDHILDWKRQGKQVRVVTVFTKFGKGVDVPNYSNDYLQKSGFEKVGDFEKARVKEDIVAMKKLGVEYEHWGYIDAGFRGGYDTREELLAGKINHADNTLVKKIGKMIQGLECELCVVPYGVGGHADHLIVKQAADIADKNTKYYLELPYLWQNYNWVKYLGKIVTAKSRFGMSKQKDGLLRCYKSQYDLLGVKKIVSVEVLF
jgi:LmbE family N-acetylglucosaminyl deacetylase